MTVDMRPARPGTAPPSDGYAFPKSLREEGRAGLRIEDRDRVDRAVGRRVEEIVARSAVWVDDRRLLLVVQLEDRGCRGDAVAEAITELAIDDDLDAFLRD